MQGVALMALGGCAVNLRYSVPAQELQGREVVGHTVAVIDEEQDPPERIHVIALEFPDTGRQILATDEHAQAEVQSELVADSEVELATDDVLTWPSAVGAAAGGAIGLATGGLIGELLFFIEAFGAGDSANGPQNTAAASRSTTLTLIVVLAGIGAVIGARVGARIAEKPRQRHLVQSRVSAPWVASPASAVMPRAL